MILLDTNLVIYSARDDASDLKQLIKQNNCFVSVITQVEALGYPKLRKEEDTYFKIFFLTIQRLPVTDSIIFKAIEIRQKRKLGLGDSLIAATAVIHNCTLYTRNIKDFDWITDLQVHNPMDI